MNVVRSAGGTNETKFKYDHENANTAPTITRPTSTINELIRKTKFSKDEIRHFYRTFKQNCPSGEASKTYFASVFTTLFPSGESYGYSSFLYQNIDRNNVGFIRFEDFIVTLSILLHGSIEDQLSWIFDFYDLNKDGILTRTELLQIVSSIFQLITPICKMNLTSMNSAIEERTNQLFHNWDTNGRGLVTKEDFLRFCLQDPLIQRSIDLFKSNI